MVELLIRRSSGLHERRIWSRLLSGISALIFLFFSTIQVHGQDHQLHEYSARVIRSEGVNPFKPMLADLQDWLPEADVTLERDDDILHISLQGDLSPAELNAHLERFGVRLASFWMDGVLMDQFDTEGRLPWLIGSERTMELTPAEVAALKDAWVREHPQDYERLLRSQGDNTDQK